MNQAQIDFSPLLYPIFVGFAKFTVVVLVFFIVQIAVILFMRKKTRDRKLIDLAGKVAGAFCAFPLMWILMVPQGAPSPAQQVRGVPSSSPQSVNTATYPNMSLVKRYLDRVKTSEECRWHRGEYLRLAASQDVGRIVYVAEQHWGSVVRNNCSI